MRASTAVLLPLCSTRAALAHTMNPLAMPCDVFPIYSPAYLLSWNALLFILTTVNATMTLDTTDADARAGMSWGGWRRLISGHHNLPATAPPSSLGRYVPSPNIPYN